MSRLTALLLVWFASSAAASQIDPAEPEAFSGFETADVIVLGEVHDNPLHHALQARLVGALQPGAIVFEMLEPRHADAALDVPRDDQERLGAAFEWEERGWPDFAMYHPILTAAPEARVFGGALPSDMVRRAVGEGAAAVFGGASSIFGLDEPLPEEQLEARVELQRVSHCNALPEEILPGMVEAQRLRDAALARATLDAVSEMRAGDAPRPVVVITGNGHAREDWGMPEMLRRAFPETGEDGLRIVTLGQFEGEAPEVPPFTHWVVTEVQERDDPCEAFRE